MKNIISVIFRNESDGYQMITELRQAPVSDKLAIIQMALVKKDASGLKVCDQYDGIAEQSEGAKIGGLTGGLIGILGGPIGMLLMGASGSLFGSLSDAGGSVAGAALLETVASKLLEGDAALIILAEEEDEVQLDSKLSKFPAEIMRYDAMSVAKEVEEAAMMETEMRRQAAEQLRQAKKEESEEKWKAWEEELKSSFEDFKKKYDL